MSTSPMTLPQCWSVIWLLATVLASSLVAAPDPTATSHPNVIVILSDDQGWGDLSLNGNSNLSTPNIDSLAADGAQFDRFYVCPVCSPTRAEFLTGRYHVRSGVFSTSAGGERMALTERTIADTFRDAGYVTGAFGKWHNGMQYPYHPNGRGFDEFYGFCSGHWGDYFSPPLERNGQLIQGEGFCVDDFTNQAIGFIEQAVARQQSFFAYVPYNTPHSPMQVPDAYWDKFKQASLAMRHRDSAKEKIDHTRCALAMCENIDWNVGRLLESLERLGVADNTIVVYFCDNGPNGSRWNGGMKGRKGSTDEGGVRSPLLVRWPDGIPPGQNIVPIAGAIDLLPTLAELCNVPLADIPLDGKSVAPLLRKRVGAAEWPDREIISHWKGRVSVRNQRFRLDYQNALFEIATDPEQRRDVATAFPAETSRLSALATEFQKEFRGYESDLPFPLGHPAYRYTQMPARDATGTGDIQRSNRFPNCSFLTNWTKTDEHIEWDVEVLQAGKYRVSMHYTCPQEDLGSVIELSCGDASLEAKIQTAHDPPLRGQENDRVERMESYVKDFGEMDLGTIDLEAGRGTLKLSAKSIPGRSVLDLRLLMFERESKK